MGKLNIPTQIGNFKFIGHTMSVSDGADINLSANLLPSFSNFGIGSLTSPFSGMFISANSLNLANVTQGVSGVRLSNFQNNLVVSQGGFSANNIFTGGLYLSGNTIGVDPLALSGPLYIGSGIPAVIITPTLCAHEIKLEPGTGLTFADNSRQTTAYIQPASGTLASQITGTWVPRLTALVNGNTLGQRSSGYYVKTGQQVFATYAIQLTGLGTATGNILFDQLPFPVALGPGVWGTLNVGKFDNTDNASKVSSIFGSNEGNDNWFNLYHMSINAPGGVLDFNIGDLTATFYMRGSLTYIAHA